MSGSFESKWRGHLKSHRELLVHDGPLVYCRISVTLQSLSCGIISLTRFQDGRSDLLQNTVARLSAALRLFLSYFAASSRLDQVIGTPSSVRHSSLVGISQCELVAN